MMALLGRQVRRRAASSEFVVRMTREETASYLGLKLETVSRLFSRLHTATPARQPMDSQNSQR